MKTANASSHPMKQALRALITLAALAATACSSEVSFSPTAPEWPAPTYGNRSLQIFGSLSAAQGSCLEATILYDGVELAGARTLCPNNASCAKLRLEGSTLSAVGHHTISFQVLQQSPAEVDYMAEGTLVVSRDNVSLGGVTLPLAPTRATLRPGEVVNFEFDLAD